MIGAAIFFSGLFIGAFIGLSIGGAGGSSARIDLENENVMLRGMLERAQPDRAAAE